LAASKTLKLATGICQKDFGIAALQQYDQNCCTNGFISGEPQSSETAYKPFITVANVGLATAAIISAAYVHLQMESKPERALMAGEVFGGMAADAL